MTEESKAKNWANCRVLIVDDSKGMQEEVARVFEALGCQVCGTCSNGVEAIELCSKLKPDLVSLDIIMPEMDGIECFRELLKVNQGLKFVFISSLVSNHEFLNSLKDEIPPHLFLPKPPKEQLLQSVLEKIFS
ncbi:MAG: response regulator [Oligoflexales bacterium]|nr:response regulator [Oligoflexales bacterium]